jgi:hypothetical protein
VSAYARKTGGGILSALLSFRGVFLFWVVYGLLNAALRISVSRTLTIDDARANELAQTFALGYQVRQPPLYEWLLWSVQQFLGPGIESHLFVRYSLIACIGLATFGAVRATVKGDRWAAAASLSLVLSFPVAWSFHEWATQTLLLCIACMLTMHAAIRYFEKPSFGAAVFLGAALSLGFYAKFSYPLLLGGLLLAALSLRETRRLLADPRLLISIGIAVVALAPYLFWLLQVNGDVVAEVSSHLVNGSQSHLERAAEGLILLVGSAVVFLLPWILLVALFAPAAFLRVPDSAPAPTVAERLALRTMLFACALAALGTVLWGATNIGSRYMHPLLFIAPVYVFARIARLAPGEQRLRQYAWVAIAFAIAVLGVRLIAVTDNPLTRERERRLLIPYTALAEALKERGIDRGTVLSPSVRESGNLRAILPELRVMAENSFRSERVPRRASNNYSCVLVWAEGQDFAARRMGGFPRAEFQPGGAVEHIKIKEHVNGLVAKHSGNWLMIRLDPGSEACR